jgi:hypothetical protein
LWRAGFLQVALLARFFVRKFACDVGINCFPATTCDKPLRESRTCALARFASELALLVLGLRSDGLDSIMIQVTFLYPRRVRLARSNSLR